jgi:hypothetical protein
LPVASGANLTNLDASDLASGTVPVARLGAGTFSVTTSTTTGATNNWAPTLAGNTLIEWSGASDAAFTGLDGGVAGQIVTIKNTGTKIATFAHASGSSDADNRFTNLATSAPTPVAASGWIMYQHDGTNWKLIGHEQGAWITPTFAAGDYTASAGNWTVDSGDVTTFKYRLSGRELSILFRIETTDVSTTPSTLNRVIPGSFTATSTVLGILYYEDAGGAGAAGNVAVLASGTTLLFGKFSGTWSATSSDNTRVIGQVSIEVT